jgi:hypothetical protein
VKNLVCVVALFAAGCADHQPSPNAGQISSLVLTLTDPAPGNLGTPAKPVLVQQATFDVQAVDDQGAPITTDLDAQLYLSFGGVKTGVTSMCGSDDPDKSPIETIHLAGGQVKGHTVTLPVAYGATSLWLDEQTNHATGASPTIYFRNPYITDVQTPPDTTAANATFCTPFAGKFIIVDQPAMPTGKLVVTSVFGDAFVITDTSLGKYDSFSSIYLYAFGKPPPYIVPGKVIKSFSGNVSKFVGFTELNFPLFDATDETVPLEPVPPPLVVTMADIMNPIKLLSADAGVVTFVATECDPFPPNPMNNPTIQQTRDQWTKYNEFVASTDGTCDSFTSFAVQLPGKQLGTYDPLANVGKMISFTGMLRNNSGQNPVLDANNQPVSCDPVNLPCQKGSCVQGMCLKGAFNFWTINPRTPTDVIVM